MHAVTGKARQNRAMEFTRSSILEAPAASVWAAVLRTDTFAYLAAPLLRFPAADLAEAQWLPEMELQDRLLLFGFIPLGTHRIRIAEVDDDTRRLRTEEGSRLLDRWDHAITVEPIDERTCRYTDRLEIEAGSLTPVVGAFARTLFWWRHRRWRRLVRELPSAG